MGRGIGGHFEVECFGFHDDEAAVFAQVVQRTVSADGEEPGCQPLVIEGVEALAELHKHVLHDVSRLFQIARVAVRIADERPLVALEGFEEEGVRFSHECVFAAHDEPPPPILG